MPGGPPRRPPRRARRLHAPTGLDSGHLPVPTHQMLDSSHRVDGAIPIQQPTQLAHSDGVDRLPLMWTSSGSPRLRYGLDQPSGGRAEHHPTRRGHRLHPLGHADLLADRGVPGTARADLPGDHLPGVQPDPQLKSTPVARLNLLGQIADRLWMSRAARTPARRGPPGRRVHRRRP